MTPETPGACTYVTAGRASPWINRAGCSGFSSACRPERRSTLGTGVGLATVRKAAPALGGDAGLESAPRGRHLLGAHPQVAGPGPPARSLSVEGPRSDSEALAATRTGMYEYEPVPHRAPTSAHGA